MAFFGREASVAFTFSPTGGDFGFVVLDFKLVVVSSFDGLAVLLELVDEFFGVVEGTPGSPLSRLVVLDLTSGRSVRDFDTILLDCLVLGSANFFGSDLVDFFKLASDGFGFFGFAAASFALLGSVVAFTFATAFHDCWDVCFGFGFVCDP